MIYFPQALTDSWLMTRRLLQGGYISGIAPPADIQVNLQMDSSQ